jgi:hypothetical protein
LFPNDKGHACICIFNAAAGGPAAVVVAVALLSYYYSRNPTHPTATTPLEKESRATTIIIL